MAPVANHVAAPSSGSTIAGNAEALAAKRIQDNEWDGKTARKAKFIFGLFGRYISEVWAITDITAVHQHHLAEFDGFLPFATLQFRQEHQRPGSFYRGNQAYRQA